MTGRAKDLRSRIDDALRLIQSDRLDEAALLLDELLGDDEIHTLGTSTELGIPRRLHSALLKIAKRRPDHVKRIGLQYLLVPPRHLLGELGKVDRKTQIELARFSRLDVPHILHQIWIGDLPVPPSTLAWQAHCRENGLQYRLWRESDLEEIDALDNPCFKTMLEKGDFPGAVDIARYMILHLHGGIYLDCDWYPLPDGPSIAALLPMTGLTALAEPTPRQTGFGSLLLTNSLIAAPPGHPLFTHLLDALPGVLALMPDAPAWWTTGPLVFTIAARRGPVCLADHAIVAAEFPRRTQPEVIGAFCDAFDAEQPGLLISWKSW